MRAVLSLALTAVLLSAGPLADAAVMERPSCCGPESPCAPAASAPAPVAIARPAALSLLPMPLLAMSSAPLFDARDRAKARRPDFGVSGRLPVRPPEPSLRL